MITRQIVRAIVYYIMPLVFVSAFYILIAKHLFQTKHVIIAQTTTRPFLNGGGKTPKRGSVPARLCKKPSAGAFSFHGNLPEQQRANELNVDYRKKASIRSLPGNSEDLKSVQNSSSALRTPSTTSLAAGGGRRAHDLSVGSFTINNGNNYNTNNNNNMIIHALYQGVKSRKQLRARHKVAKTVLFLCSVFFICWLPKQIHDFYW